MLGAATLSLLLSLSASAEPGATEILADFEGPVDPAVDFIFAGDDSSVAAARVTVADDDALARPGQVGDNSILSVDFNVIDFGGWGQSFDLAGAQDWSNYTLSLIHI